MRDGWRAVGRCAIVGVVVAGVAACGSAADVPAAVDDAAPVTPVSSPSSGGPDVAADVDVSSTSSTSSPPAAVEPAGSTLDPAAAPTTTTTTTPASTTAASTTAASTTTAPAVDVEWITDTCSLWVEHAIANAVSYSGPGSDVPADLAVNPDAMPPGWYTVKFGFSGEPLVDEFSPVSAPIAACRALISTPVVGGDYGGYEEFNTTVVAARISDPTWLPVCEFSEYTTYPTVCSVNPGEGFSFTDGPAVPHLQGGLGAGGDVRFEHWVFFEPPAAGSPVVLVDMSNSWFPPTPTGVIESWLAAANVDAELVGLLADGVGTLSRECEC